jgi:hypothetical protein
MRHQRSITVLLSGLLLLLGLGGCASDSTTSTSATSQIAQAQGEPAQPPSGAVQEPGSVQPPPGTEVPAPPTTAGEQGQGAQGEPPAGEIQERGIIQKLPSSMTAAPAPSGMAPPPGIVGPTENITKVARSLQVRAKSLTTHVVFVPGSVLTRPVTITVDFNSPGYSGVTHQSAVYNPEQGNHFFVDDFETTGAPRPMTVTITLSETIPKQGKEKGGLQTFTYPGPSTFTLVPLYNVTLGPLKFSLTDDCDLVGKSDISFGWWAPEGTWHQLPTFKMEGFSSRTIQEFAWSGRELGQATLRKYYWPLMGFIEHDPGVSYSAPLSAYFPRFSSDPNYIGSLPILVPNNRYQVMRVPIKGYDCSATGEYWAQTAVQICHDLTRCQDKPTTQP